MVVYQAASPRGDFGRLHQAGIARGPGCSGPANSLFSPLGPALAAVRAAGPVGGRQLVTVAAHGLDNYGTLSDARCEFGGVRARAFVKTATAIVCAAPPHASGSVAVRVSLNGVDFTVR